MASVSLTAGSSWGFPGFPSCYVNLRDFGTNHCRRKGVLLIYLTWFVFLPLALLLFQLFVRAKAILLKKSVQNGAGCWDIM